MRELWIKNDTCNPSWSFKDRVVAVASSRARQHGFDTLACASTGNLANAVSAHAARAGMRAIVFIPHDLEAGKVLGSAIYNPTIVSVNGSYDDVNRLCSELADNHDWAFVNINVRPYYSEGSRTLAFEVAEQLGWKAPRQCVAPMASGSLFTKIHKGFEELQTYGLIEEAEVRMIGAQATGCSPISTAWENGTTNIRPVKPNTIAKSLAIGNPADGYYALKTMAKTDGGAASVSDAEVVEGIQLLAQTEGVFAETAGGVTIAGLRQALERGPAGSRRINRRLHHRRRTQNDGRRRGPRHTADPGRGHAEVLRGRLRGGRQELNALNTRTAMANRRVRFTFEGDAVREPVIYLLGHEFAVVTNIRMADVEHEFGWVVLELEGDHDEIDRSLAWVEAKGVRVDPVSGDVVES